MAAGSHAPPLVLAYKHQHVFAFERGLPHERIVAWLADYWHYSVPLSAAYIAGVFYLQAWMRNRKPFRLSHWLTLWNAALTLFSVFGFVRTSEEFLHTTATHGFYKSICFLYETSSVTAHWYLYFALSKVAELADTLFLVLRKRRLTFLHCYHHCTVLVFTFNAGAEMVAAGRWFMWMNLLAHSCMYAYYTLMSAGVRVPRRFAKCVTLIQIAQMILGVSISVSAFYTKYYLQAPCQQSGANLALAFGIYVSYAILFIQFFVQAYHRPKPVKSE